MNIVVIIMDDLTWGDLSSHGNPHTRTPNLDQMRDESTRFTHYRSGFLCTPARAAITSGRHPYRTRAIDTYCGRSMMDPDEQTIASYLRDAGYATCLSGKWHLGDTYPNRPIDLGFDECLMHTGGGLCQPSNYGNSDYFNPTLLHNGELIDTEGYCTDIFTDHTIQFIRDNKDGPFFVYLATNAPHTPAIVGDEWSERFIKNGMHEKLAKIYGMVENIDHNVGRVFDELKELGIDDDTLVLYTSDHGLCPGSLFDGKARYNANMRGGKGTPYEGGVCVPCFWRWPGHIQAGVTCSVNSNPIDVFPTLRALAGIDTPTRNAIDGRDLSPVLLNGDIDDDWAHRFIPMQWHRGNEPVRYRNYHIVRGNYKLCRTDENGSDELYNIAVDRREEHNIADEQPELCATLRQAYDDWFDDVSRTRENNYAPTRIIAGTPHENPIILNRNDWRVHGDDGWDASIEAHWEMHAAQNGTYTFRCEFPELDDTANVRLLLNDAEHHGALKGGETVCDFALELDSGDIDLESYATTPAGDRFAPKFVIIRRGDT
jgi:arylsulfatase/arylsulfatase A